jgi:glucose-6-phosphate isomerase
VLVNSKTFTTAETMLNAKSVKQWLMTEYGKKGVADSALIADRHICACSTNLVETSKFGINEKNVFGFWDFVGGRFSVWSAIGILPLSIHFGYPTARAFLDGAHSIDTHLLTETTIHVPHPPPRKTSP